MDDAPGDVASGLIDLTKVDLDRVATLDDTALARALRRIRDEIAHPEEAVAAFQSSL